MCNPQFERMFGYDSGELVGQHVSILNAPNGYASGVEGEPGSPEELAQQIVAALENRRVWSGKIHNVKKDGTEFWCYATVRSLRHLAYGPVWVALHEEIEEIEV